MVFFFTPIYAHPSYLDTLLQDMTGATCIELTSDSPQAEVRLNDEDIEQLLCEAEDRLRPSDVGANSSNANSFTNVGLEATSVQYVYLSNFFAHQKLMCY